MNLKSKKKKQVRDAPNRSLAANLADGIANYEDTAQRSLLFQDITFPSAIQKFGREMPIHHMKRSGSVTDLRPCKIPRCDTENPIVLVHNDSFQKLLQQKCIPYGVQFELARLITNEVDSIHRYREIINTLSEEQLHTHVDLVPKLFETSHLRSEQETASSAPWSELDKETEAFDEDPHFAGIGNNLDYPGWWAGKVDFRAKLEETGDRIVLEKPSLGPSNKLQRRFGSPSVLRVKVNSKLFYSRQNHLVQYFKRPLIIWSYVFRAFCSKENTVFFFKTNEVARDGCISTQTAGLSLYGLIQWMNPLELNGNQKLCKWASRMALGLSSSIPGPRLSPEDIVFEPDLGKSYSEFVLVENDPSTNMTDGCGTSNLVLHQEIYETYRGKYLDGIPTAFQFRLAGSKGLLLLAAHDGAKVRIRTPSQVKINYPAPDVDPLDPSHLTIDILRFSRIKTPARLSAETIQNLHENGVPASVFVDLLERRLRELVEGLTTWEGPDAIPNLWKAVEAAEGVVSARKARQSPSDGRVQGFRDVNEEDEDEDAINREPISTAWWRDPISGCPSSLAETVLELLDSGFTPLNSPYLRDKLKQLVKMKVNTAASKFNYVVPQSASAFVVPDPYGVLKPDEIHFKSSRREFVMKDGTQTDIILGDVLMTRNPCKVPTDVRKVKAVQHPALNGTVNVIVCSVQGSRRLLDFLAGGDYDGDRGTTIWDEIICKPLWQRSREFCERHAAENTDECQVVEELQEYLLGSLVDPSYVGEYSRFHENAVYKLGYSNPSTVKLAYQKRYAHPIGPAYKEKLQLEKMQKKNAAASNCLPLERSSGFLPFILDILVQEAGNKRRLWLEEIDQRFGINSLDTRPDPTLTAPWTQFYNEAKQRQEDGILKDLQLISKHVEAMYEERTAAYHRGSSSDSFFSSQHITQRQDTIRDLSKRFSEHPEAKDLETLMEDRTIARLRASYAYIYALRMGHPSSQFPFDRAFKELCAIKAESSGLYKVCLLSMYERRR
ncbi:hypothetical protein BT96DRAFT_940723 [Gymnopus androsaceus JB14]|uniref:RNA-dependent RNA polymerase n=1 Tax=Gymnopus androsaceus JB14 TaxID=1447944 RepID=A0A6A4HLI2_9AGAR|nr:hypothetical protein BT96DRAFT_940723 [Gymnopus androsaceus JB14]